MAITGASGALYAQRLLDNLELLASHNLPALRRNVGVEMDELSEMIAELEREGVPSLVNTSTRLPLDGGVRWVLSVRRAHCPPRGIHSGTVHRQRTLRS